MNFLSKIIKNEQFNPKLIGIFTNPFYFSRKGLFNTIVEFGKELSGTLLDVGCGSKPYEKYLNVEKYIGLEIKNKELSNSTKADFFYDGKIFPFKNAEFDSVISNEVLEHVFNPDEFLNEINRVLKLNGKILISVPFVWDEHEQPFDFARYSSFGLKHLLQKAGFEIIKHKKSVDDIRVIFQLWNEYIYKKTYVENVILRQFLNSILISPFTILGILFFWIFPKNNDLYLDNVILAKKISDV